MAWPKGLLRSDAEKMKADGTWDAWLANYRASNPDTKKATAKSAATPKAPKAFIDPLTALHDRGLSFIAAIEATPLAVGYDLAALEKLHALAETMHTVIEHAKGAITLIEAPIERLEHEAQLVERAEALEGENEVLKAQLAEMAEALRVAGHGEAALQAVGRRTGRPKGAQTDNRPAA